MVAWEVCEEDKKKEENSFLTLAFGAFEKHNQGIFKAED